MCVIKEGTPVCGICAPEDYYHRITQNRIAQECADPQQQWIYKLIDLSEGRFSDLQEEILINDKDWFMCYNVNGVNGSQATSHKKNDSCDEKEQRIEHKAHKDTTVQNDQTFSTPETAETRTRYLVIFKDTSLKTLRDLTSEHVPILIDMQATIRRFLSWNYGVRQKHYNIFFHYMPSVFQLHAHVSPRRMNSNSVRRQPVSVVTRNLLADSLHYQKCLMYTLITVPPTRQWRESRSENRTENRSGTRNDVRDICGEPTLRACLKEEKELHVKNSHSVHKTGKRVHFKHK